MTTWILRCSSCGREEAQDAAVGLCAQCGQPFLVRFTSPAPARDALVNGRFTAALGDEKIPVEQIIESAVAEYLAGALPLLDVARDVVVRPRVTQASSPGAVLGDTEGQRAGRRAKRRFGASTGGAGEFRSETGKR